MINFLEAILEVKEKKEVTDSNSEKIKALAELGMLTYDIDLENQVVTAKINDQYRWIIEEKNKIDQKMLLQH